MAAPQLLPSRLDDAKRAMRARARALRTALDPSLGGILARHLLADCPPRPEAVVAGFWPMGGEIDIRPLLSALHERGHAVGLPVTPAAGSPLTFRRWWPGMAMRPERFGTWRPVGEELVPEWLLVPLLAFDRRGGRLGYGGGYYDRTLAGLPGTTRIGCAYSAQEVEAVPMGPDDVELDAVATEAGVIVFPRPLPHGEG